ncbi:hypothetical protein [Snodgrassella sp. ESL0253]|uniref:hypothetical protein n=1 Tax=Snodgrassella sp. ESL0253 TaxID=2705031 RepID=UPI001581CE62|nr:hypothetical protein [Snodgrassella sp. ESL0253]NUE66379.1 hypothetical protein [Snodgrassella sp. ESL0253]
MNYQLNNFAAYPATEHSASKPPLSAFVGIVRHDNLFGTPLFEYNLERPLKKRLYRRLTLKVSLEAELHQGNVHCNSGIGNFKALREAQSYIEYPAL